MKNGLLICALAAVLIIPLDGKASSLCANLFNDKTLSMHVGISDLTFLEKSYFPEKVQAKMKKNTSVIKEVALDNRTVIITVAEMIVGGRQDLVNQKTVKVSALELIQTLEEGIKKAQTKDKTDNLGAFESLDLAVAKDLRLDILRNLPGADTSQQRVRYKGELDFELNTLAARSEKYDPNSHHTPVVAVEITNDIVTLTYEPQIHYKDSGYEAGKRFKVKQHIDTVLKALDEQLEPTHESEAGRDLRVFLLKFKAGLL